MKSPVQCKVVNRAVDQHQSFQLLVVCIIQYEIGTLIISEERLKIMVLRQPNKEPSLNHRAKDTDGRRRPQVPPATIIQTNPPGHSFKLKQYRILPQFLTVYSSSFRRKTAIRDQFSENERVIRAGCMYVETKLNSKQIANLLLILSYLFAITTLVSLLFSSF